MPLIPDSPGFGPQARPTLPTPGPDFPEVVEASFRRSNELVSAIQNMRGRGSFAPVEGYNVLDEVKDKPEFLAHPEFFAGSRSPAETQLLMDKVHQMDADDRTAAAAGPLAALTAGAMASSLSLTMLLPGKIAFSVLKDGRPFVRSAIEVGAAGAAQSSTQDTLLRASQPDRPVSETIMSIGSATVMGAILGPAARWLSPSEREALTRGLDHERALNDAHVSGLPVAEQATAPVPRREPAIAAPQERIRNAYEAAKAEQGGISAVPISELVTRSGLPMDEVHSILLDNARQGGASLHEASSVNFPPEVAANAIHLPGERPFAITVLKDTFGAAPPPRAAVAMAAGAAAADVRSLESLTLAPAYGLTSKFAGFLGKTIAAMNRMSLASRKGYADLVELSLLTKGNIPRHVDMRTGEEIARGEPPRYQLQPGETAAHGGAPLESIAATQMKATTSQIRDELLNQWMDLAFGGAEQAPRFALSRSGLATVTEGRFGGLPADKPTFEEFGKMVSKAIQDNNVHDIPQVQKAAETISRDVFDKWGARAEAAKIVGFKRAEQAEGEGYFPHVWNKVKIAADRFNFVNQLTDRFMADQATKLQAQGRIRAYRNSLDVNEEQIAKLTRRMEKKQADLEEDEALREEVSKINKFAYRRAEALREGEFINVGGVAVPVPGKNIQKARGGAPFETVARARINELADRASGVANEIAEIDEKLLAAHFQSVEMRGKIEDEIGKWQGKSAAEAKSALKARAKYEAERDAAREAKEGGYGARAAREERKLGRVASADKAVDDAVDRILGKNYDRPREDIRDRAQETTNRILSSPDGRLPYDESAVPNFGTPSAALPSYRGSLAERALNVSNKFAAPWIEDNIERVVQNHLRTFVPDVLLSERFGDMEMSNVFRDINRDYEALSDAAKGNSKQQKAIEKDRQGAIRDLAATRDMFRGLYNYSADAVDQKMARLSANLRNANVPMNMANALTSSLGDATGSIFRFGLMNTFRDSFFPYFRSLATDQKYNKEVARQAKAWGITDDYERATRHRSLSGVAEDFVPQSPVERFLAWSADKTQIASGLAAWTDWIKTRHATVVMAEIYRAGKAVERGNATEKQLTLLAASNIEPDMAIRIAKLYETSGNRSDGVLLPNTADWKGSGADQAKEAFVSALHREVNLAVVTPGLDRPLWMAKPMLALLGQYKSFVMAATTRIMIANLQRSDGQTLQGLIAAIGLGMLGYKINSLTGGQPTSDNPMDWVKEGMSRANIFGVMEEFNSMASKMTRGQADMYRVIGATKPLSRYQALSSVDMLLGPTVGKLRDLSRITGGVATGDLDAGDIKAARRFIFLQNAPYFRGLFNEVETGINNAFGIPQQAPRRQ